MCLHLPLSRIRRSDAVVVLYSIVDRDSFEAARMALAKIGEEKERSMQRSNGHDAADAAAAEEEPEKRRAEAADPASVSGVGSALAKASRLPLVTLLGNKTDLAHLREVGNVRKYLICHLFSTECPLKHYGCKTFQAKAHSVTWCRSTPPRAATSLAATTRLHFTRSPWPTSPPPPSTS